MTDEKTIQAWHKIEAELRQEFISDKAQYFGDIGEIVDGALMWKFCSYAFNINEPAISRYGIGLLVSVPPDSYSKQASIGVSHPAFIKTNRSTSLPLYAFGVTTKERYSSGLFTFYKIFFEDETRLDTDFNSSLLYNLKTQHAWQWESKKRNIDGKFSSVSHNFKFETVDLSEMSQLIRKEFEKSGEVISVLKKNNSPKKLFGLF